MIEKEIWSEISKKEYDKMYKILNKKFGNPEVKRRLSFRIGCTDRIIINTRIKIEDSKVWLLQKVANDLNDTQHSEFELEISNKPEDVLEVFKIFKNLLGHLDTCFLKALQFENLLYRTPSYEVKLTHQFGKSDVYSFEVEVFNNNLDPITISKELGFSIDLTPKDNKFWVNYSARVNLDLIDSKDDFILDLIKNYI